MQTEAMIFKSPQQNKEFNLIRTTAGSFEIVCAAGQLQHSQGHSRNSLTDTVSVYTTPSSIMPTREEEKVVFPSLHLMAPSSPLPVLQVSRKPHLQLYGPSAFLKHLSKN